MVKTVGIDLSLTATGVAHSDGQTAEFGLKGVTQLPIAQQISALTGLAANIAAEATRHGARVACIEALDMAQSYGGQIERTALWWDVVTLLWVADLQVYVAPSPQVKMYATGKGAGDKKAVLRAIQARWPTFQVGDSDNRADAASCALIAAHKAGWPIEPVDLDEALVKAQQRALSAVREIRDPPPPRKLGTRRPKKASLTLDAPP